MSIHGCACRTEAGQCVDARKGKIRDGTYGAAANQIAAITNATAPTIASGTYLFNGFNQRVQKVTGGVTTQFVYDTSGHLIEEADGSGTTKKQYIWLDDLPVAMVDSTGMTPVLYFIHADQIGSPQKLTNGALSAVWDGVFDPFGNPASGASLSLTNMRFPGQYLDAESGLNQNWNRDYDKTTGRYIQSDPIGLDGGSDTYGYVGQNPFSYVDPRGEVFFAPILWGIGIGIATDVVLQLALNDGQFECIDPWQVAFSAGLGAIGGGAGSYLARLRQIPLTGTATLSGESAVAAGRATRGGESAAAAAGRQAHRELAKRVAQKPGWRSEPRLRGADGRIRKPDIVTPRGFIIELKPNTASGHSSGARQIRKYEEQLGMPGRVIYYDPPVP